MKRLIVLTLDLVFLQAKVSLTTYIMIEKLEKHPFVEYD